MIDRKITPSITTTPVLSTSQSSLDATSVLSSIQSLSSPSSVSTPTSIVLASSGGLTRGAIGAIVGAIVGGFIILSATVFLVLFRRRSYGPPRSSASKKVVREDENNPASPHTLTSRPQDTRLEYAEEAYVGARIMGTYPEEVQELGGRIMGN